MSLVERHKVEQHYHDRASEHERTDFYAWGALDAADRYAYDLLGDVRGRNVLDLGCGDGRHAQQLAEQGAHVVAIDLSLGMVRVTQQRLAAAARASAHTAQMSAEELGFRDGTFDLIFGHSVLHHTDLAITRREVERLLRPGGRAIFLEPLDHNPLLNLFRALTPWRRTPTERPLSNAQIAFLGQPFRSLQRREFYLAALLAFALVPLRNPGLFQAALRALLPFDEWLFARWPSLRQYAWAVVLEMRL
ncbi:MAG TPA: methyltransferase domain-containing protein [Roseiflexaceae bacterium]|nr:methyltransferase domain-containing protein [Roseiflexaceae bacterium]